MCPPQSPSSASDPSSPSTPTSNYRPLDSNALRAASLQYQKLTLRRLASQYPAYKRTANVNMTGSMGLGTGDEVFTYIQSNLQAALVTWGSTSPQFREMQAIAADLVGWETVMNLSYNKGDTSASANTHLDHENGEDNKKAEKEKDRFFRGLAFRIRRQDA